MAHGSWKTMHWRRGHYVGESSVRTNNVRGTRMSERRLWWVGSDDVSMVVVAASSGTKLRREQVEVEKEHAPCARCARMGLL